MKLKQLFKKPEFWISAAGSIVALLLYIDWVKHGECFRENAVLAPREFITGFIALALFVLICIQFVPRWLSFWKKDNSVIVPTVTCEKGLMPKLFCLFLLVDVIYLLLVSVIPKPLDQPQGIQFWLCLDSDHYINIARDGYLSTGDRSRIVELVFLPGYPLLVRLVSFVVRNELYAGLVTSGLCFASMGCAFYKLLRLDFDHKTAMRTIKYLLICPGVFFFVAPMSESLYLLVCILCLYWVRTGKVALGCIAGAVASFTRSVGLALVVPVFFELVHQGAQYADARSIRRHIGRSTSLLIIPLGFAAYCAISYFVSGNPLQFMEYQSNHWGQEFGYFFAKVADQFERVIKCCELRHPNLIGMWLPNFISCFGSLVIMNITVKKLRPTYTAWFVIYYAFTIGATALLSGPRYLLVCFPLMLSLGLLTKNKYVDRIMTVLCIVSALIYTYAFVMRWCVW